MVVALFLVCVGLSSLLFLINSLEKNFTDTYRALLGADLRITSSQPVPDYILQHAKGQNLKVSQVTRFYSMLSSNSNLTLCSIKALESNFPLRNFGDVEYSVPKPGTIGIENNAKVLLKVKNGDKVKVGNVSLIVADIPKIELDRLTSGFSFAPTAIINMVDLGKIDVLQAGSRATYYLLVAGDSKNVSSFEKYVNKHSNNLKFSNSESNSSRISANMQQGYKYLNLGIFLNVILAAIVIAVVMIQYNQRIMKQAAILSCLGISMKRVAVSTCKNLFVLAVVFGLLGSGVGFGLEQILSVVLGRYMQINLPMPDIKPLIITLFAAILLIPGIGLPLVLGLAKFSPWQILKGSKVHFHPVMGYGMWLCTSLFMLFLFFLVQDARMYTFVIQGMMLLVIFSFLTMQSFAKLIPYVATKLRSIFKFSLYNILRNLGGNIIQVLAFSVIICVACLMYILQGNLLQNWQQSISEDTPNYFVINIFKDNINDIELLFKDKGVKYSNFYPVTRGELIAINQKPATMHRSLNLTWLNNLPNDNIIIKGDWPGLSVEENIAKRLNLKIGDFITFKVGAKKIQEKVTSIRKVTWTSFKPNFYFIYPAGVLQDNTATYMGSFYLPENKLQILPKLIELAPETSIISVKQILESASFVVKILIALIAYIWIFSLLLAVLLLVAVILSSFTKRIYQNNLLRVFGASKIQLNMSLFIEFGILAVISSLSGALIANSIAYYVSNNIFDVSYKVNYMSFIYSVIFGSIIVLLAAWIASYKANNTSPVKLLNNML